jgi:hypothetical protein
VRELPALHIKVGIHRLIEHKGAVAGLCLSQFVWFGDFLRLEPEAYRLLVVGLLLHIGHNRSG